MRPQPFRQRLPDPPAGWRRYQGCSRPASRVPLFPCSPEGRTFATDLASALHDRCGKPIPALLKGHSAGGTSVPTGNTGACRRTDCVSRTEPSRLGLVGFVLQNHFLPLRAGVVKTTPASMRPCPFRHHLPNLRKHGCRWKRGSRPASRVAPR